MICNYYLFQVIRDLISEIPDGSEGTKTIIDYVVVKDASTDLAQLARTESRVFLLYCTRKEAISIMSEAKKWVSSTPFLFSLVSTSSVLECLL